jgi:hypothetical protein
MNSSVTQHGPQIDYEALAAAIVRAGLKSNVVTYAQGDKTVEGGDKVVEKGSGVVVDGVGQGESWADAVEHSEQLGVDVGKAEGSDSGASVSSVEIPGRFKHSAGVRKVQFGGLCDGVEVQVDGRCTDKGGYFATVVKNANSVAFCDWVAMMAGVKLPKKARESLSLCTYTAGTMPDVAFRGKDTLNSLAAIGDAMFTTTLCVTLWARGDTVERGQAVRSKMTSNARITKAMVECGLVRHIAYAPGVDAATSKATATAFEAIVGVLTLYRGHEAVRAFIRYTGLLEF